MGAMAVKVDASKMWFEQEETEGTERGFFGRRNREWVLDETNMRGGKRESRREKRMKLKIRAPKLRFLDS